MHLGFVMECDLREGEDDASAFREAIELAEWGDTHDIDSLWMVERHFAGPEAVKGTMGAGIPSVSSAPIVTASAMAARTERIKIGIGVSILPLHHPVQIAEDAAALDHISNGRLEFGVGRSMDKKAYDGYGVSFDESTARQNEALEVIRRLWTEDKVDHEGQFYTVKNANLVPKPLQRPHPPIWFAINRKEAFFHVGRLGYPILIGLRGMTVPELKECIDLYREQYAAAGHKAPPRVLLRAPIHVGDTLRGAQAEAEASTMRAIERQSRKYSVPVPGYNELLKDKLIYGDAKHVAERIREIAAFTGVSGMIAECNLGSRIPHQTIKKSLRLLGTDVRSAIDAKELTHA